MDPTIPTPTVSSTVTSSSVSTPAPPPIAAPFQILELSLISAQDLAPVSKSMRTYAMAWMNPNRKLNTRTDQHGHTNPTWNDKFMFRVDNKSKFLENAAITIEIYTVTWFRDVIVGTVKVLVSDLLAPPTGIPLQNPRNMRFVALQVRRPSGIPQGILNMGVAILDSTMRSMPLQLHLENFQDDEINEKEQQEQLQQNEYDQEDDDHKNELDKKIHLWRSLSVGSELNNDDMLLKSPNSGSVVNGSMVNGSELCSDIGPSASIVAAELAKKLQPPQPPAAKASKLHRNTEDEDTGSSILEDLTIEEAKAKGYRMRTSRERWRKEMSECGESELSSFVGSSGKHSRRNSDGGLFSCFGNAYGIEVTIVCGASNPSGNKSTNSMSIRKKSKSSETNSA